MGYEVKLTTQAIEQIKETVQYISKTLLEPETARKWADTLQSEIENIFIFPKVRCPFGKIRGYVRKVPVKGLRTFHGDFPAVALRAPP